MALADNREYKVVGSGNLANFKIIGIEAGKTHILRVQYYQTVQCINP